MMERVNAKKVSIVLILLILLGGMVTAQKKPLLGPEDRYTVSNQTVCVEYQTILKADITTVRIINNKSLDVEYSLVSDKPTLKLFRWNESEFRVVYPTASKKKLKFGTGKVSWEDNDVVVDVYPLDIDEGGVEFDVILKEKPTTNVIAFNISTENLSFYYQPPLNVSSKWLGRNKTPCNDTHCGGAYRPENVVGSYAVYHTSKAHNNYGTGKFVHIYRPLVKDEDGKEIWGVMDINEKDAQLTITIPQSFLDKARYPVYVDPTFGHTSIGASADSTPTTYLNTGRLGSNATDDGTAYVITFYCKDNSFRAAFYDEDSDYPKNLLMNQSATAACGVADYAWTNLSFSTNISITADTFYDIAWKPIGGTVLYKYDSQSVPSWWYKSTTDFSDPHEASYSAAAEKASFYVMYSVAAADSTAPTVDLQSPADLTNQSGTEISFQCNASDETSLVNITLFTNISGSWATNVTNSTGIDNTSIWTHKETVAEGAYSWNCFASDTANNMAFASANYTVTVDSTVPSITLDVPAELTNTSTGLNTQFDYTPVDSNLRNCSLWMNASGTFERNQNDTSVTTGATNTFYTNLSDGAYIWNVECFDWADNSAFASTNRTLTVDTTTPSVGNLATFNEVNSTTSNFNYTNILVSKVNVSDVSINTVTLDVRLYNHTLLVNNASMTSITDNSYSHEYNLSLNTSSQPGNYTLTVWATDNSSNVNSTQYNVTVNLTVQVWPEVECETDETYEKNTSGTEYCTVDYDGHEIKVHNLTGYYINSTHTDTVGRIHSQQPYSEYTINYSVIADSGAWVALNITQAYRELNISAYHVAGGGGTGSGSGNSETINNTLPTTDEPLPYLDFNFDVEITDATYTDGVASFKVKLKNMENTEGEVKLIYTLLDALGNVVGEKTTQLWVNSVMEEQLCSTQDCPITVELAGEDAVKVKFTVMTQAGSEIPKIYAEAHATLEDLEVKEKPSESLLLPIAIIFMLTMAIIVMLVRW